MSYLPLLRSREVEKDIKGPRSTSVNSNDSMKRVNDDEYCYKNDVDNDYIAVHPTLVFA